MKRLLLPVRVDWLGGWSDQSLWGEPAAVVNAAVGWSGQYPLRFGPEGFSSLVGGEGTGLGISSLVLAGRYLQERRDFGYVAHVLQAEAAQGTHGGWQDQLGGVEPGFKLIERRGADFRIHRRDDHPLLAHTVLFDTGVRRDSGAIGAKIRSLLQSPGHFRDSLRVIVGQAREVFHADDADRAVDLVLGAWRTLCAYVPEMSVPVPSVPGSVGHKLCGAGGGGFGLMFSRTPEERGRVVEGLRERGLWAKVPELLPGARYE